MRIALLSALLLVAGGGLAAQAPSAAAPPIGAWRVVPELPGMGRPVDTAAVAARRRALLQAVERGVVVLPAAHERDLVRDHVQDNGFRQSNTFFYFSELETPDAWLVLAARGPDSLDTALFLPPRAPDRERWTGLRLGPDGTAARLSGIPVVLATDSLEARLRVVQARVAGPVYVPLDDATREERRVVDLLFAGRDVRNLRPLADSLRMVKDADELARLRTAVEISIAGHVAAMQAARPGIHEYEIEAALEAAFRKNGADRVGYPSIVGSGPNTTTLHYDVNRRQTRDGDLVVVDAGAEWGQYTADITRTFPVNGRFAPRQKAIYDLVLATQQAAFDSVRPGVTLRDLDRVARTYMRDHSGALCGDRTCDRYFSHGLGHHIGMDVHDVNVPGRQRLEPGMVFTIEPGIYLPQESLGVRIEDDVLVTAAGGAWLSDSLPRATAEIERLMRRR
jgi:Xaa-Pro aminopeptidase